MVELLTCWHPKRSFRFLEFGVVKMTGPEYFYYYAKLLHLLNELLQFGVVWGTSRIVPETGELSSWHWLLNHHHVLPVFSISASMREPFAAWKTRSLSQPAHVLPWYATVNNSTNNNQFTRSVMTLLMITNTISKRKHYWLSTITTFDYWFFNWYDFFDRSITTWVDRKRMGYLTGHCIAPWHKN